MEAIMEHITRDEAYKLLKKYNKDPFHIQHALTVEAVMKWYAKKLGYESEMEYWGIVGLLHDIDFELYPAQHCLKAPELLRAAALMRPSKSTKDMELKSLKKKYKSKGFAAGCSREVIERGASQLGWELDKLLDMTLQAMADSEDEIASELTENYSLH